MLKKKIFVGAVAALSIIGLAACGGTTTQDDGQDYDQNTNVTSPSLVVSIVGAGEKYANWSPADSAKNSACLFTKISSSHYQLVVKDMVASSDTAWVGFKFVQDGSWGTQYGVEDMDWAKSTPGFVKGTAADYNEGTSNRSNFEPLLSGTMTVDFYPYYFLDSTLSNKLVITVK